MFTEEHGVGEIDREQATGEIQIVLKGLLRGKQAGSHDDQIDGTERCGSGVEGRREGVRPLEIAEPHADAR